MLRIDKKIYKFKIIEVWFADTPSYVGKCDSIVFRACKNKVDVGGFKREEFTTLTIDLTQDIKTIWDNMKRKSCQYAINRALRDNVQVSVSEEYQEFYNINKVFREKKGLPVSHESVETMQRYGTLFTAKVGGEMLGGQFYLADDDNIRWLLGASKRLEVGKESATLIGNANRLMIWEAIKYAKQKGIKEFGLGGCTAISNGQEYDSIDRFKLSFGGNLTTHYTYCKDYSMLYKITRNIYQWMH